MRITKTRHRDNTAKCVGANGGEQKYIGTLGGGAGGFLVYRALTLHSDVKSAKPPGVHTF